MKKRIVALMLILMLAVGALSGCGANDAPIEAGTPTNGGTTDSGTQEEPAVVHKVLTENRSVSCGPESALLNNKGVGFVPTARAESPEGSVRVSRSMVFEGDEGAFEANPLVFSYDDSGRKIASGNRRPNGDVDVYETFSYDEQGRLFIHEDLAEEMLYMYTYDGEGRLQVIDHYSTASGSGSDWKGQMCYSYDGDMVSESYFPAGSSSSAPQYYTVYSGGKIVEYHYDGKYDDEWDFYEYDELGNLKYMFSVEDGERELVYEYLYDEDGVLIQVSGYSGGEPDGSTVCYSYNEAGDCIRIEFGSVDWKTDEWALDIYFELTYDAYGNLLTEKGFYADGESLTGYYMSYTYDILF